MLAKKVLITREVFSSYTTGSILKDETHLELKAGLQDTTVLLRGSACTIRIDNAPGFQKLKNDTDLVNQNITLDFGRIKNRNKTAVADKCIQELEDELRKLDPQCSPINSHILQRALTSINKHVRNRGLSSRELIFQRDQYTGDQLDINDHDLSVQQHNLRLSNHPSSAQSKSNGAPLARNLNVTKGDLVYIKQEGDKFHARELYIIVSLENDMAILQKLRGNMICSRKYTVPLSHLYKAVPISSCPFDWDARNASDSNESSSDGDNNVEETTDFNDKNELVNISDTPPRVYPLRDRRKPIRYGFDEFQGQ